MDQLRGVEQCGLEFREHSMGEQGMTEPRQTSCIIWAGDSVEGLAFQQGWQAGQQRNSGWRDGPGTDSHPLLKSLRILQDPQQRFSDFNGLKNNTGWGRDIIKINIFGAQSQEF